MKNLNLENFGVQELNAEEILITQGGEASPQGIWSSLKNAGKHALIAVGYAHLAVLETAETHTNGARAFYKGFFNL